MSSWVGIYYWIISTITKQINLIQTIIYNNSIVTINKPTNFRVIVTALEIVQPGFGVVVISAIAEGVHFAYGFRLRAADAHQLAPAVVDIADDLGSAAVQDADDVSLAVADVVILTIAPLEPEDVPAFVVVVIGLYVTGHFG